MAEPQTFQTVTACVRAHLQMRAHARLDMRVGITCTCAKTRSGRCRAFCGAAESRHSHLGGVWLRHLCRDRSELLRPILAVPGATQILASILGPRCATLRYSGNVCTRDVRAAVHQTFTWAWGGALLEQLDCDVLLALRRIHAERLPKRRRLCARMHVWHRAHTGR